MKTYVLNFSIIIISLITCEVFDENSIIKSESLRKNLDEIISLIDKQRENDNSFSDVKSYWIVFDKKNNQNEISLIANFNYYSSKNMIGYFNYNKKIVSVYEFNNFESDSFINKANLRKGIIESLVDYDSTNIISEHNPIISKFKVMNKDKLVKIE